MYDKSMSSRIGMVLVTVVSSRAALDESGVVRRKPGGHTRQAVAVVILDTWRGVGVWSAACRECGKAIPRRREVQVAGGGQMGRECVCAGIRIVVGRREGVRGQRVRNVHRLSVCARKVRGS